MIPAVDVEGSVAVREAEAEAADAEAPDAEAADTEETEAEEASIAAKTESA